MVRFDTDEERSFVFTEILKRRNVLFPTGATNVTKDETKSAWFEVYSICQAQRISFTQREQKTDPLKYLRDTYWGQRVRAWKAKVTRLRAANVINIGDNLTHDERIIQQIIGFDWVALGDGEVMVEEMIEPSNFVFEVESGGAGANNSSNQGSLHSNSPITHQNRADLQLQPVDLRSVDQSRDPELAAGEEEIDVGGLQMKKTNTRGIARYYRKIATYPNEEQAMEFVTEQLGGWSKTGRTKMKFGFKVTFRCNKVRRSGPQCAATVYIFVNTDQGHATVFQSEAGHTHDDPNQTLPTFVPKLSKLTDEHKKFIDKCISDGIIRPRAIVRIMAIRQKEMFPDPIRQQPPPLPTITQINNRLAKRRKELGVQDLIQFSSEQDLKRSVPETNASSTKKNNSDHPQQHTTNNPSPNGLPASRSSSGNMVGMIGNPYSSSVPGIGLQFPTAYPPTNNNNPTPNPIPLHFPPSQAPYQQHQQSQLSQPQPSQQPPNSLTDFSVSSTMNHLSRTTTTNGSSSNHSSNNSRNNNNNSPIGVISAPGTPNSAAVAQNHYQTNIPPHGFPASSLFPAEQSSNSAKNDANSYHLSNQSPSAFNKINHNPQHYHHQFPAAIISNNNKHQQSSFPPSPTVINHQSSSTSTSNKAGGGRKPALPTNGDQNVELINRMRGGVSLIGELTQELSRSNNSNIVQRVESLQELVLSWRRPPV